ncbi:MAG: GntR family transcriptional regulator [Pseudomonadota bacterium]
MDTQHHERAKARRRVRPTEVLSRVPALHTRIAEIVRDRIVEGMLEPGDFVDEAALAGELSVSRTPVREALKVLSFEGLVENEPNRGTFVAHLNPEVAADLLEFLAEVEGFGGALAAARADDATIRDLRNTHDQMVGAHADGDKPAYFKLNTLIHDRIAGASGNAELHLTFTRLTARLRRLRFLSNATDELWRTSVAEHEAIQARLEARDSEGVRAVLRDHVLTILPSVADILRQDAERLR